jgi:hypothetical protein
VGFERITARRRAEAFVPLGVSYLSVEPQAAREVELVKASGTTEDVQESEGEQKGEGEMLKKRRGTKEHLYPDADARGGR